MTQRLTIILLVAVWAILITGGLVTYIATRAILIDDLDQTLVSRALSLPDIERPPELHLGAADRYKILDQTTGHRTVQPGPGASDNLRPALLRADFSSAGGVHMRTVTLRAYSNGRPVTIVYSGSTARLDYYLSLHLFILMTFILLTGLAAALMARAIARAALRPLTTTADAIGQIDERRLDRRIDTTALAPELIPMACRLNEMLARLEQSFALRKQFLADASHELRTPIAALVTSIEVGLRRHRSPEQYVELLEGCLSDARHMRGLVEGLLEHVRAEQFDAQLKAVPADLTACLMACAEMVQPLARNKSIALRATVSEGMAGTLDTDRLRSIVLNLLSNAIEYNKPVGHVELLATLEESETSWLLIRVSDTGLGIAPEHQDAVFHPFYRVDSARSVQADTPHLGLGLALVRRHTQAMGGTCQMTSKIDEGTTFSLRLPLGPRMAPVSHAPPELVSPS